MNIPLLTRFRKKSGLPARGFTLVEILVGMSIGLAVMGAIAAIFVVSARLIFKNQQIDEAITNTRFVQEHLNNEMSVAISQITPVPIRPHFTNPSGTTPVRYACVTYRVPIGSFATVATTATSGSTTLSIVCPSDVVPQTGDYLLMDEPDLGDGILIDNAPGTSGTFTVTLQTTLAAKSLTSDSAVAGKLVRIQRERKYETVAPDTIGLPSSSEVTELHWFPSTANADYTVLSRNVDTANRYLFAQVPEDTAVLAPEPAFSWQFSYLAKSSSNRVAGGDNTAYYQTSYAAGLIMPRSGNPLSTSSLLGGGPISTTTTTLGTSTTSQSSTTTTLGTSTTKLTSSTSQSTSTTAKSTSSSKSTSSTVKSTTSSQSTSSTSNSTSTTKVSTSSSQSTSSTKLSTSTTALSTSTTTTTTTINFDG